MKKEVNKAKYSLFFKCATILMLAASVWLVHFEYLAHHIAESQEPKVLKVHIEPAQAPVEEDDFALANTENNDITTSLSDKLNEHAKLDQYRVYLEVVGYLCVKFLKHENYEAELVFLHKNIDHYPAEIVKLLGELEEYEVRYLSEQNAAYTKLHLNGGFAENMVTKILDIEKKNPEYEVRVEEYNKLSGKLGELMAYFYSKEFLKQHHD